jgi:hypothetical protein
MLTLLLVSGYHPVEAVLMAVVFYAGLFLVLRWRA